MPRLTRTLPLPLAFALTVVLTVVLTVLASLLSTTAQAQYPSGTYGTWNNPGSEFLNNSTTLKIQEMTLKSMKPGSKETRFPLATGVTSFRPGRSAVLDGLPEPRRRQTAEALARCSRYHANAMATDRAQGGLPRAGLNDLASSASYYLLNAHAIYWRRQPTAPPGPQARHLHTLREQLRARFIAAGTFSKMSDLEKQAVHDGYILDTCSLAEENRRLAQVASRGSPDRAGEAALGQRAIALLAALGFNPHAISFNPDGSVTLRDLIPPSAPRARRPPAPAAPRPTPSL